MIPSADDLWWMTIDAEKPGIGAGTVTYRSEKIPEGVCTVELLPARAVHVLTGGSSDHPWPSDRLWRYRDR